MKFTKIAVAVAALVGAAAASAQTANVAVYGSIRVNVEVAQYSQPGNSKRITSVDNVSSRFGFRGSESLGGGMNAIFQLEAGFASDTGAAGSSGGLTQIFSREAWVGLNGGFGELKLGYGLTPYDDVLGWAHHQGANSWENRNNGVSGGAAFGKSGMFTNYVNTAGCNSTAFDARYGNSISYASPNMSGFQVRTQYAFIGEAPNLASGKCSGWDTAVRYSQGPIRVGLTHARHNDFTGMDSAFGVNDQAATRAYASFDAGFARIDGTYEVASYDRAAGGTLKYKYWEIGAVAPMGANTFGIQYSQRDKGLGACWGVGAAGPTFTVTTACRTNWDNGGGKHLSLTHDYALSRRTTIRSYYTDLKNETGGKVRAFSMGLWHNF